MAGWVGKYHDVITTIVPHHGLHALHALLALHALATRRKAVLYALVDEDIPPGQLLRYLPRSALVKRARLPPDPLFLRQEAFHLARNSDLVVSPLPFDASGIEAEVVVLASLEAPAFEGWRPFPRHGEGRLDLGEDTPVEEALRFAECHEVHLHLPWVPEGLVLARGDRTVHTPRGTFPPIGAAR